MDYNEVFRSRGPRLARRVCSALLGLPFSSWRSRARSAALHVGLRPDDGDDVLQDSVVRFLMSGRQLDENDTSHARLLSRLIHFSAVDRCRRAVHCDRALLRLSRDSITTVEIGDDHSKSPVDVVITQELVNCYVVKLADPERHLLALWMAGATSRDIGNSLAIGAATARQRVLRILRVLRIGANGPVESRSIETPNPPTGDKG